MDDRFDGVTNHARGAMGEVRAEQYLADLGYTILDHNASGAGGEIDLIAEDGRTIVFVEVKVRNRSFIRGREVVTFAKQRRICKAAVLYMKRRGLMNRQARFDVIEIQDGHMTHLRNAFPYRGAAY